MDQTSLMGGGRPFPETSWSLIQACQQSADADTEQQASLERLFRLYWGPVYLHIRRHWTQDVEQAKDLTQAFFLTLLEREDLGEVNETKGRFRSYVLACLRNFLLNQKRDAGRKKRSPGKPLLSLDAMKLENSAFDVPAPQHEDIEKQFDADWSRVTMAAVLDHLRTLAAAASRPRAVELLVAYDLERAPEQELTYADLASRFGLRIGQVRSQLRWARQTFLDALRSVLSEQVLSEADLEREAALLFGLSL